MEKRPRTRKNKTTCSKCGEPLEAVRVGKQRYCNSCHAKQMRETRPKHLELPPEERRRAICRANTNTYLKRGKIVKTPCEVCGSENVQAHHDDYSKPKQVRWFCRQHHNEWHEKHGPVPVKLPT